MRDRYRMVARGEQDKGRCLDGDVVFVPVAAENGDVVYRGAIEI